MWIKYVYCLQAFWYKHPQLLEVDRRDDENTIDSKAGAKGAGGRWNPEKQLWFVQYGKIVGTQLEKHIQVDEKDNNGKPKKHLYVYTS